MFGEGARRSLSYGGRVGRGSEKIRSRAEGGGEACLVSTSRLAVAEEAPLCGGVCWIDVRLPGRKPCRSGRRSAEHHSAAQDRGEVESSRQDKSTGGIR